ncbi:hypothetical protein [uncultured Draconibacterium sp.]|uniref:hypothetical protein n=1 Tax=uncultured Draconibacterium sp. TaxID=1573823 RepID=UPI003260141B
MKKIIGFTVIALAVVLFSCNTNTNDGVEIPEISAELTAKSAEIAVAEIHAEAATTEGAYEVEFFANAEGWLSRWWKMGKHFTWSNKLRYHKNHCPDVSIESGDDGGYPKTITLNYGDSTLLNNGKVLSGEIVIEISAHRSSQDYTREVIYNNFGVDSLLINGTSEIVVDKVDSTYRKFESELTFVYPDGTTIVRSAERIWQWSNGLDTDEDQSDDMVHITGELTATITWPDGSSETYTKEITQPLKRMATCRYIVEGEVQVHLGGNLVSVLDYGYSEGDDECDHYALLTNADGEQVIDLSERKYKGKEEKNENGGQQESDNQNGNGQNGNG